MGNIVNKMLWLLAVLCIAPACSTETDTDTEASLNFAETALPTQEILTLVVDENGNVSTALRLGRLEQGLVGESDNIAKRLQESVGWANGITRRFHNISDALVREATPAQIEGAQGACTEWNGPHMGVNWSLRSCPQANQEDFSFSLVGFRDGETPEDGLPVMGGVAGALASYEDQRRGKGHIAYDLNALQSLTGEGGKGRIGVGYRFAGAFQQVNFAMEGFSPDGSGAGASVSYEFQRLWGQGGIFRYDTHGDMLQAPSDGTSPPSKGEDGVHEYSRVTMSWAANGSARSSAVICGGSLGDGRCILARQCWGADQKTTYEELIDDLEGGEPWPESCPKDADLPIVNDAPPPPEDLEHPPRDENRDVLAPGVAPPPPAPEHED